MYHRSHTRYPEYIPYNMCISMILGTAQVTTPTRWNLPSAHVESSNLTSFQISFLIFL